MNAIGIMSGTSVDGLDIIAAAFSKTEKWTYNLVKTTSVDYPKDLRTKLLNCIHASAEELVYLDLELGQFIGKNIYQFLKGLDITIDLIASHGHTVFHQPARGMTKQIGNGQTILKQTGIVTINDFRTMDVLHGGQGAPLVPIGDQLLFGEYDVCLNIGGFANISYTDPKGNRLAFDTGPANLLLNHLSRKLGYRYDAMGENARSGRLLPELFDELNALPYFHENPPKSLGLEWVKQHIFPKLDNPEYKIPDLLHTCTVHIAHQINKAISEAEIKKRESQGKVNILATGGGAHNNFLTECLSQFSPDFEYHLPDKDIIDYKEALIFAFLGVLRYQGLVNVLKSATGATIDSIGGTIHNNLSP